MVDAPPILNHKSYGEPSIFTPGNLLREARRQRSVSPGRIPEICILDPDGDMVHLLQETGRTQESPYWPCYHTRLYTYIEGDLTLGMIGQAVGASFAVLVAEELFASGCRFLISVTSAGEIMPLPPETPTRLVLIERALRDEGTSYHYLPPATWSNLQPHLCAMFRGAFEKTSVPVTWGATWTTDAPFRETESAIKQCREFDVLAVEMEAAALYAFAQATGNEIACFAQVTNQMATVEGDFEKDVIHSLEIVDCAARHWLRHRQAVHPASASQDTG
ncbi:MAG: hypothetical protein NVSMB22_22160 [Chloroflexota bacterium]